MNADTSNASLLIHSGNPDWLPENSESFIRQLQSTGLMAEAIPGSEQSYLAGDKFLELIAFMGCSPNINFSPDDAADSFCFIRLRTTADAISALTGKHTHAPRCPHCNKPEKNWREKLSSDALQCASCGRTSAPWLFNWRKSAGFARLFIEITDIYPKEAIPQDALLSALESISNSSWKYFYHYA